MTGLRFDFEENDIIIDTDGSFVKTVIDSQNCALISLSQICRITRADVGEQIAAKLQNRKQRNVSPVLASAVRAVQRDGGRKVSVTINAEQQLQFKADYGED